MPRNGAGTFRLLNAVAVGALRSSSAVNANFTDMGGEITNSLPINGEAGMSGQLKADDGGVLAPGITFGPDTNTGFRRSTTDEMRWVVGGVDRATMDADGKLAFVGGFAPSGALTKTSGFFGPQTMAGTSAPRSVLRLTANDTDEHDVSSYQSGSGAGARGSLRLVGGGANDASTMRFYVNDVLTFQFTGTLFTHAVDALFGVAGIRGDVDGFLDIPEISAPLAPTSNIARAYARDASGVTNLFYKDSNGAEYAFQPPVDRQFFTTSNTWARPSGGQTTAMIECWGGGGSGATGSADDDSGGGGGGGGAYARRILALASLSVSVSVTVASGGAGQTGIESSGNNGGDTSFGVYVMAFGGTSGATAPFDSGRGGGLATSGGPQGALGAEVWGATGHPGNANAFGGGGRAEGSPSSAGVAGSTALLGGASGGSGGEAIGNFNQNGGNGGLSVFGGGGGGGGAVNSGTGGSAGSSVMAGSGSAGVNGTSNSSAGQIPSGGSGGTFEGDSGAGGRGEIRVTCW